MPPCLAPLTLSCNNATHHRRAMRHCLIRVELAIELLAIEKLTQKLLHLTEVSTREGQSGYKAVRFLSRV